MQTELGIVGVQRKEFPNDFLASVHDGRLNMQLAQMQQLDLAILLLEGKEHWTTEGTLIRDRGSKRNGWSRSQHRNYLTSVQMRGVQVSHSDSLKDTMAFLCDLQVWCNKPDHSGLLRRGTPPKDSWGRVTNRDYAIWLIQGLPGVGPKQATAILDTVGFPFILNVTVEELMRVAGVGKVRAEKIVRVFAK